MTQPTLVPAAEGFLSANQRTALCQAVNGNADESKLVYGCSPAATGSLSGR